MNKKDEEIELLTMEDEEEKIEEVSNEIETEPEIIKEEIIVAKEVENTSISKEYYLVIAYFIISIIVVLIMMIKIN